MIQWPLSRTCQGRGGVCILIEIFRSKSTVVPCDRLFPRRRGKKTQHKPNNSNTQLTPPPNKWCDGGTPHCMALCQNACTNAATSSHIWSASLQQAVTLHLIIIMHHARRRKAARPSLTHNTCPCTPCCAAPASGSCSNTYLIQLPVRTLMI